MTPAQGSNRQRTGTFRGHLGSNAELGGFFSEADIAASIMTRKAALTEDENGNFTLKLVTAITAWGSATPAACWWS